MYNRILLPTDGTRGSDRATRHAIGLAAAHDATLYALYVIDQDVYQAYGGDEYVHDREGLESALEQRGTDVLSGVETQATEEGVEVITLLERGVPHEQILDTGSEVDADVIVLGTEERPGEYRRLLGSVTERVARRASRPVSIVKTPPDADVE